MSKRNGTRIRVDVFVDRAEYERMREAAKLDPRIAAVVPNPNRRFTPWARLVLMQAAEEVLRGSGQ